MSSIQAILLEFLQPEEYYRRMSEVRIAVEEWAREVRTIVLGNLKTDLKNVKKSISENLKCRSQNLDLIKYHGVYSKNKG